MGSSASTIFTVVSVSSVGLGKYSVFDLLIFSPFLSNTTLHDSRSSSTSSRVIAHRTRSSANIIAQGGSLSMFSVKTSIIIMNKRGHRANPWCNPTFIGKYSVSPFCVTTCVLLDLYMSCTIIIYSSGTPFFLKHHQIRSLGILSNANNLNTPWYWKRTLVITIFICACEMSTLKQQNYRGESDRKGRDASDECLAFRTKTESLTSMCIKPTKII